MDVPAEGNVLPDLKVWGRPTVVGGPWVTHKSKAAEMGLGKPSTQNRWWQDVRWSVLRAIMPIPCQRSFCWVPGNNVPLILKKSHRVYLQIFRLASL